jgi:hypothetical protein
MPARCGGPSWSAPMLSTLFHAAALKVLIPRSKTGPDGKGHGSRSAGGKGGTPTRRALEDRLRAAAIRFAPVFRIVTRDGIL